VAVSETGRALDVSRCFIRLGVTGEQMTIGAEWDAEGVPPIGQVAERLPVTNLATSRRETVAIADVLAAPELEDADAGSREILVELGARAVLATPIVVFDQMIGTFVLHSPRSGSGPTRRSSSPKRSPARWDWPPTPLGFYARARTVSTTSRR
jgi:GAF domain-containing protein